MAGAVSRMRGLEYADGGAVCHDFYREKKGVGSDTGGGAYPYAGYRDRG